LKRKVGRKNIIKRDMIKKTGAVRREGIALLDRAGKGRGTQE